MERREHGWWYSNLENRFKCDYEAEDGEHCAVTIPLDIVIRILPKDDIHLAGIAEDPETPSLMSR